MKLSFIVPIYNVEDYLLDCCKSILNQVDSTCEVLLVDDGSTDRSSQIADDIAREHDRVTVIHKENGGLASARNTGLDAASGDYVAFVDSDDLITENCSPLFSMSLKILSLIFCFWIAASYILTELKNQSAIILIPVPLIEKVRAKFFATCLVCLSFLTAHV